MSMKTHFMAAYHISPAKLNTVNPIALGAPFIVLIRAEVGINIVNAEMLRSDAILRG